MLKCPHPYLALSSVKGPTEVWWLNAFTSPEERDDLEAAYARNEPLMAVMRPLGKRKEDFRESFTSTMTRYRQDLSGGAQLRIAGTRFLSSTPRTTKAIRRVPFSSPPLAIGSSLLPQTILKELRRSPHGLGRAPLFLRCSRSGASPLTPGPLPIPSSGTTLLLCAVEQLHDPLPKAPGEGPAGPGSFVERLTGDKAPWAGPVREQPTRVLGEEPWSRPTPPRSERAPVRGYQPRGLARMTGPAREGCSGRYRDGETPPASRRHRQPGKTPRCSPPCRGRGRPTTLRHRSDQLVLTGVIRRA